MTQTRSGGSRHPEIACFPDRFNRNYRTAVASFTARSRPATPINGSGPGCTKSLQTSACFGARRRSAIAALGLGAFRVGSACRVDHRHRSLCGRYSIQPSHRRSTRHQHGRNSNHVGSGQGCEGIAPLCLYQHCVHHGPRYWGIRGT